jgi:hypothetical protein
MLVITVICAAILGAGHRLTQFEPEIASAAAPVPVVNHRSISVQATTFEEVQARTIQPLAADSIRFFDDTFGYVLNYPANWAIKELSSNVVIFHAFDGSTRVKVEVAGVLPVDGLAGFVERSLGQDIVLTRQMLTIHGRAAERVLLYSDTAGGKITTFYISADNMVYVISGSGDEAQVEAVARSFNTPQVIALQ